MKQKKFQLFTLLFLQGTLCSVIAQSFVLAPHNLPRAIAIVAGNSLTLSVPKQDSVHYEWKLLSWAEATISGAIDDTAVTILANYKDEKKSYEVVLWLKRYHPNGIDEAYTRIIIYMPNTPPPMPGYTPCIDSIDCLDLSPPVIQAPLQICEETPFVITSPPNANIVRYQWDFNDGTYNFGDSLYHTYTFTGMMRLQLTITTANGCTASATHYISVHSNTTDGNISSSGMVSPDNPVIIMYSNHYLYLNYTWNPGNITNHRNLLMVTQPGIYSVTVVDPVSGCRTYASTKVWSKFNHEISAD
jgi:hypothetical protein